jgi:hypothetical protein
MTELDLQSMSFGFPHVRRTEIIRGFSNVAEAKTASNHGYLFQSIMISQQILFGPPAY